MDATRSSSALMVFKTPVIVHGLGVTTPGKKWASVKPGEEWEIKCSSKKAYGCGTKGQQLAEGLTLYVHRVGGIPADLTSYLSVGVSDEAAGIMGADLRCSRKSLNGAGEIKIADRQALVVLLLFRVRYHVACGYYLVYDATDASLSLIPLIPKALAATYTVTPVPGRSADGLIKLVLMARLLLPQKHERADRDRLCVWTPAEQYIPKYILKSNSTPAAQSITESSRAPSPWQTKVHRFSEPCLTVDVSFSLGGKAFWADLCQGVVVSDLMDSPDSEGDFVDTKFIVLPDEYQVDYWGDWSKKTGDTELMDPANMSRTMGCFKDSIKFVCIDRHRPAGDTVVKVLTLDLDQRLWEEDKDLSFSWDVLWEQVRLMDVELRDMEEPLVPMYPTLMPDGALVLLLPIKPPQQGSMGEDYYVCSFDMYGLSPRFFGRVLQCDTPIPLILPSDFFPKRGVKKLPSALLQKFEVLSLPSGS